MIGDVMSTMPIVFFLIILLFGFDSTGRLKRHGPFDTNKPDHMKTKQLDNTFLRLWQRITGRRRWRHDPFLSLSLGYFNFASGSDRILQKQQKLSISR
jgi:hypothetical protein